jgi:nucleoid-associated protein YgaU
MTSTVHRAELTIEGTGSLKCLFNPAEYTLRKQNAFAAELQPGASVPVLQYAGGRPAEMTVELLFDVTLSNPHVDSIIPDTDRLFHAMEPEGKTGEPPIVVFKWGATESFAARVADLDVQYVLFRDDGTPVRAWARMTLVQAKPSPQRFNPNALPPGQNPTTRADGAGESWVVRLGDSLPSIAYASYGDQTTWRTIARANRIDDPFRLRTGTVLTIPPEGAR